jgi:hypothetical protein
MLKRNIMFNRFPIQNGLFNSALEYAIGKVQENQLGQKLYGIHQLLAYVNDANLLGDNIDTIKKNTETLLDASREVDLEINIEELGICCCLITRMQVKTVT